MCAPHADDLQSAFRCFSLLLLYPQPLSLQVRNAARIIGDPSLYKKMEVASQMIKRDIVFASSLYVS